MGYFPYVSALLWLSSWCSVSLPRSAVGRSAVCVSAVFPDHTHLPSGQKLNFVTLKMRVPIYNEASCSFMWKILPTLLLTEVHDMSAYFET